jgi:metallo-beta-lactamase class B
MRLLAGLVVALATLASTASAQSVTDFLKSVMANWTKPTEPFKVIDNI